ncbi:MAG: hypothetical protein U0521_06240 [Anaerolineae bacterium]
MADITFEDVLKFAEQLTSEEERLIEQFQAQGAKPGGYSAISQ